MARSAELRSREKDMSVDEEDDDCTEAPDWGDSSNSADDSSVEQSCQRMEADSTELPTEDKENCQPVPTDASSVHARLEKPEPDSTSSLAVGELKPEPSSPDKERMVLGQKNTNSPTSGCNACKRKRSESADELREACESILPKRAKSSDSECQTEELISSTPTPSAKQNSEGSITSLVSIFKSGFHGLSGEANPSAKPTNIGSSNHLQQSSYASSMPRPFEQLQMPIAAC
jgi:hypothetical protein